MGEIWAEVEAVEEVVLLVVLGSLNNLVMVWAEISAILRTFQLLLLEGKVAVAVEKVTVFIMVELEG